MYVKRLVLNFFVVLLLAVLNSCTSIVTPNIQSSEYLTENKKVDGTVHLYISKEFKKYTQTKVDISDLKNWKFELGTSATDAFRYALESKFTNVSVSLGVPNFPLSIDTRDKFFVVVTPSFNSFYASDPILFKFENFHVNIKFQVDVFDVNGNKLISELYDGKGTKRGAIGYASAGSNAYPVAAKQALNDAIHKAIDSIVALNKQ